MPHGLQQLPKLDFSGSPINRDLSAERKIAFYRQMSRIRRFEQASLKYYNGGKMGGFLHLYIGQESVAVGTISLRGEHDHIITAYRDHGHALSAGMGMNECMAELFGKLDRERISVSLRRTGEGEALLRVSPHFYNTEEEVERLAAALAD